MIPAYLGHRDDKLILENLTEKLNIASVIDIKLGF